MEMYALYDYRATDTDQLSFRNGDLLKILSVSNRDWLSAELHGKEGVVPGNYVQFILPTWFLEKTKKEASDFLLSKQGNSWVHPNGAFLVRPSESNPTDLSVSVRIKDTVHHFKILRSDDRREYLLWRTGPFFTSVTELISTYYTQSIHNSEHAVLQDLRVSRVMASYQFDARDATELTIYPNEIITVLDSNHPDMHLGQLEREGSTHRGYYPANYVTPHGH